MAQGVIHSSLKESAVTLRRSLKMREDTIIELPSYVGAIAEWVVAQDLRYFELHPGALAYCRPYVPGEVWPLVYLPGMLVLVRMANDGACTRTFLPADWERYRSRLLSPTWAISA
jgi:hypothetical protein